MDDGLSHQNTSQRKGKGTGRRKIEMQKIQNQAHLQVTFSKRRTGVFKKASELDTLCGTESAVVAFSPTEKAYAYGNPDVETITEMYFNSAEGYNHQEVQAAHDNPITRQRNQKVTDLERQLELERKYNKELNRIRLENQIQFGVPPNLDELNYQQLDDLRKSVLCFKQEFQNKFQNPMGSDNAYTPGSNPIATTEGAYGYTGLPSGSNFQGSSYMGNPYGDMEINFSNYPALFNDAPNNAEPSYPNNGYVDPMDQMNGNLGLPSQNPHDTNEAAGIVYVPCQTSQGHVQGNNQGFPNNYGGGF